MTEKIKQKKSSAAKAATRRTFALLEEHYLEAEHRYEEGWSDERIAREVKLSAATVAEIRTEHFGPVEDPRITALRADAQKIRAELGSETAELAAMAKTIKAEGDKRLDAIERRIAGLR